MGMQLIFVVETNKKSKSDWMYIKNTIDRFYKYDPAHVKLSTVYMAGKTNYAKKEKEIKNMISQYNIAASNNMSHVIYCFDCDDYDINPEDKGFLKRTQEFCNENGYEHAWFCKDIESVYLGKKVEDGDKTKEAVRFVSKKLIDKISQNSLKAMNFKANSSNLLIVLDKFMPSLSHK